MKNLFKSLMLVAVAAMGFTACSKESFADVTPEVENVVKMTITADGEAVRTYLDEANDVAKWNESDEYIRVYQLIDDAENASFVKSSEGVVNGNVATFGASFAAAEGTSFTYSAIYPASAGADNDGAEDLGSVKLILSDSQKPSTTSFDAAADLMIAKTIVEEAQVTELSLQFKRVVAVAKMSLTNLDTADKLVNVTFEATNKVLAGRSYFNLETGEVVEYGYNSPTSKISLMYSDAIANNNAIYFTCLPTELAAGDSFTVTATTENGTKYTRTVTLAGEQALNFKEGKMSTFSVNMATADKESVASLAGEYAIMAKADGALQIMGNQTSSYLTRTTVAGSEIPSEYAVTDLQYIWVVEKVNSNYTIKQKSSGKYVSWSSGNSATLATDPYELTIEENNDGYVTIKSVNTPDRKLQYNAGNPRFAFYTSVQTAIYLVPATINTNPVISVANTTVSIEDTGATNQTITVNCVNFDAADLTVTKAAGADWLTVSYNNGTITYSATANTGAKRTAEVTLSADGADDVVITFTQAAPIQAISIAEFIDLADTETYYELTGVVSNVENTQYGNFTLTDESGSIYVYGLYSPTGAAQYWTTSGVKEGDTLTIRGKYKYYSKHEVVSGRYVSHTTPGAGEGDGDGEGEGGDDITLGSAYSFDVTAKVWTAWNTAAACGAVSWTPAKGTVTGSPTVGNKDGSGRGQQFGAASNNQIGSMTMTAKNYSGGIKSIDVKACAKSGNTVTIDVTVGGVAMTSTNASQTISDSNSASIITANFTSDVALTGDIVITYTLKTKGALYVSGFAINNN